MDVTQLGKRQLTVLHMVAEAEGDVAVVIEALLQASGLHVVAALYYMC